ncbi:GPI-anchored surface protein, putative [Bodo saltans]|uniref:GPI-anchored surface protein, putative n=1 Tax=Bodo saltans TaxID=75058 RepID=A0A0S4IRH9_BODSA|nr:GPI-anchored surface protein, putative [Bodo saltans]|eukprot:CUF33411.1 GPI-anchored surface protein, putative [Bodo saltans]
MKLLEADEEVMLRSIIIITQIFVTCKFSGTFAARIAQSALLSWFRHASFLKGDGFVSLKREANHQFHLAQKRQDDQHQTLAPNTSTTVNESAENVAKQEDDNLTPLFEDDIELRANESAIAANEAYDGMLQYSPRATQGCFAYDKAEVRVAFVGDSTSVGYPKKVGRWTRLACSGPCVNGTHPEVDVRHYNFAVASTTVTDSDDKKNYRERDTGGVAQAPGEVVLATRGILPWKCLSVYVDGR